jgi:hypothetical protein
MAVRWTIGLLWALLIGLAGGWLVLTPWALGGQAPGSRWSTVTDNEVGTGLGLILLAVVSVAVLVRQTVRAMRGPGGGRRRARDRSARSSPSASDPEMEQALVRLATAISADLERGRASAPYQLPPRSQPLGSDAEEERRWEEERR